MLPNARHYIRFQPAGLPLTGHGAETSDGALPTGYLFAYEDPTHAFADVGPLGGGWVDFDPESYEVVTFTGSDAYDPGDYEGVAVRPGKLVRRETVRAWIERATQSRDGELRRSAREWLGQQVTQHANPGVIELDEEQLAELIDELAGQFVSAVEIGERFRPVKVVIHDVRGREKSLRVGFYRSGKKRVYVQHILHGEFDPKKMTIDFEASVPSLKAHMLRDGNAAVDRMARELRSMLVHELTHARDYLDHVKPYASTVSRVLNPAYVNSPHEVRAFGRQIAEEVRDAVLRGELAPGRRGDALERLTLKYGVEHYYDLMTPENQRIVLGMVSRFVGD